MTSTLTNTDRIEKKLLLRAPQSRVWRAVADSAEFGKWFNVKLDGPFVVGKPVTGRITKPGADHLTTYMMVERIDPEHHFSFRWHPYAIDPKVDYSSEPTTLVEFHLEAVADGTMLTVVESGFDRIPAHRRDEAFRMNDNGWSIQVENIRRYVSG